jgi:prophage maintenance system killer protein
VFYLTVHDIVWLNTRLTGRSVAFDYEKLEAAMAAQYGYGESRDVLGQATRFAEALLRDTAFEEGNLGTALLCVDAYLRGNGVAELALPAGLADTVRQVREGRSAGSALVAALVGSAGTPIPSGGPVPSLRAIAARAQARLAQALRDLAPEDGPAPGWAASPLLHRD